VESKENQFGRCQKCGFRGYCSKECQVIDWKSLHKHRCEFERKALLPFEKNPKLDQRVPPAAVVQTQDLLGSSQVKEVGLAEYFELKAKEEMEARINEILVKGGNRQVDFLNEGQPFGSPLDDGDEDETEDKPDKQAENGASDAKSDSSKSDKPAGKKRSKARSKSSGKGSKTKANVPDDLSFDSGMTELDSGKLADKPAPRVLNLGLGKMKLDANKDQSLKDGSDSKLVAVPVSEVKLPIMPVVNKNEPKASSEQPPRSTTQTASDKDNAVKSPKSKGGKKNSKA
jgi:hypothetical protein